MNFCEHKLPICTDCMDATDARLALLEKVADAAKFKRNTIIHNGPKFVGRWVAVPEVDFDKLQAALRSLKEGR